MEIRGYTFDAGLSAGYVDLCRRLYADDPNWINPGHDALLAPFVPSFFFYNGKGNRHCHFAALDGGRVIGHVTAHVHADARGLNGEPVGYLGLFECIDDSAVARELIQHAVDCLEHKGGVKSLLGPIDFDIWHGYRFKRRGFERETFLGEPYNRPYYPRLFEENGFAVAKTWFSTDVIGQTTLEGLLAHRRERHARALAGGYTFRRLDARSHADLRELHALLSESYRHFPAFTPIAFDEFTRAIAAPLRALDTRFFTLAYAPTGNPAGFCLAFPDPSAAMRAMRGRRDVIARLKFVLERRRARRVIFHSFGVAPGEREKGHGLGSAIFHHVVRAIVDAGYDTVVAALLAEDSPGMGFAGEAAHHADREYVLYGRTL